MNDSQLIELTLDDEVPVFISSLTSLTEVHNISYTYSRAGTAYVKDFNGDWIAAGVDEARFQGARRIDHSDGIDYGAGALGIEYSATEADGTPLTALDGLVMELARTNFFLNSGSPVTQTIDLSVDIYVLWLEGSGTVTATSGGVAVAAEFPVVVTAGSPVVFSLTTGGDVDFTISGGTPDLVQVEDGFVPTSYIPTTGVAVTRAKDILTYDISGLPVNDFTVLVDTVPSWDYDQRRGNTTHPIIWASGVTDNFVMLRTSQSSRNYVGKSLIDADSVDYEDVQQAAFFSAGDSVKAAYVKRSTGIGTEVIASGNADLTADEPTTSDIEWGPTLMVGCNLGIAIPVVPAETDGRYNGAIKSIKIINRAFDKFEAQKATAVVAITTSTLLLAGGGSLLKQAGGSLLFSGVL